jgi:preprotein translocase subunit SecD
MDANLTTLMASILLYIFGSGPVRGFSVTLGIGIITSLFTAILFTRFLIVLWINAKKPKTLVI